MKQLLVALIAAAFTAGAYAQAPKAADPAPATKAEKSEPKAEKKAKGEKKAKTEKKAKKSADKKPADKKAGSMEKKDAAK